MQQSQLFKQMIQFNKAAFDNSLKTMTMLQEQTEKTMNVFLEQAAWLPAEGKKAINEWVKTYKKGCEDFKKVADENFKKVEDFFASFSGGKAE